MLWGGGGIPPGGALVTEEWLFDHPWPSALPLASLSSKRMLLLLQCIRGATSADWEEVGSTTTPTHTATE